MIKRKREFVSKLLQGAMSGLAYMHDNDRLHQSLGPSSVVLKYAVWMDSFPFWLESFDKFNFVQAITFSVFIWELFVHCF